MIVGRGGVPVAEFDRVAEIGRDGGGQGVDGSGHPAGPLVPELWRYTAQSVLRGLWPA